MSEDEQQFTEETAGGMPGDLRPRIADLILERIDLITEDTVAIFPFSGEETLDSGYSHRLGQLLVHCLASAVRDGTLEPRAGLVVDLHQIVLERAVPTDRLFTLAYLIERTTLDELALNESLGATSEPWPQVAQLVRRASFDLLGAYVERTQLEPGDTAIIDRLTTLYTRPLFEAVLAKELERSARYGYALSLILFDVDQLSTINKAHGYGVGDMILERLGILIRKYFRQHDWVARHAEDSIAVLLSRTEPDDASELAEKVRSTVEGRLGFTDHRTDQPVTVTVTAAVINVQVGLRDVIDPDRLTADAEATLERAKRLGRNRVERLDGYSGAKTTP